MYSAGVHVHVADRSEEVSFQLTQLQTQIFTTALVLTPRALPTVSTSSYQETKIFLCVRVEKRADYFFSPGQNKNQN